MTEWTQNLYPNVIHVQPHEPPRDYQPNGFHPVTLGDSFHNGRYIVKHKLGFGGQATVWLACDMYDKYAAADTNRGPFELIWNVLLTSWFCNNAANGWL